MGTSLGPTAVAMGACPVLTSCSAPALGVACLPTQIVANLVFGDAACFAHVFILGAGTCQYQLTVFACVCCAFAAMTLDSGICTDLGEWPLLCLSVLGRYLFVLVLALSRVFLCFAGDDETINVSDNVFSLLRGGSSGIF